MDNHELYHYGIKGQRWGIRRFQKKNGSLTPAGKKRKKETWSEDATEASKIRKKPVKEMSNAELKRLNERIRLEQEYSRLNPSNSKKALAAVTATATAMGALLNLYNNSDKIVAKGKPIVDKLIKPAAEKAKKEMAIGMWSDVHSDELYHFGVKGMKWGRRKVRGHAGPGRYATKKRQLAGDKKDLEALNKGQHLSAGVTKKRQAAYDARDRAALEKRIAKGEKVLSSKQIEKSIEKAKKTGRLVDIHDSKVMGVKQKNGDILFVDATDVRKLGVDAAEQKAKKYVEKNRAKGKKATDKEEKELIKDLMKNYDKNDPDYHEAMALLSEMYSD